MNEKRVAISEEVRAILSQGRVEDNAYFLPPIQLDRSTYVEVNKILELSGGKWNRSLKAHLFDSPEKAEAIRGTLETGNVLDQKATYQFFETPKPIAQRMVELANIKYVDYDETNENDNVELLQDVIEPSAGHGAIADEIDQSRCLFRCNEIDHEKCKILEEKGYPVACIDFLESDEQADRFIMNPPFTKGQDADHVLHAYSLLRRGGRLVAIMSASVTFNQQKRYQKIRDLVEESGQIIELPDGAFKESGTNVRTVIVVLDKQPF